MDLTVLEKLGMLEGSKVKAGKIFEEVNQSFKTREDAREVCGKIVYG